MLYQMSKNMNKRFFAEFIALLSLKINPDPYLSADPEIDILKRSDDEEGPNGDSGVRLFVLTLLKYLAYPWNLHLNLAKQSLQCCLYYL